MYYHKLTPLFSSNRASKFYLNRKYQGLDSSNSEWENFGSIVKDYHKKTNLNKYLFLLKNLDKFEQSIIQENFKILKNNKDITNNPKLWKGATSIQPYQTFNKDKKIYQGYNKNHFHNKINLNKLNQQTGGNYPIIPKPSYQSKLDQKLSVPLEIQYELINNLDDSLKTDTYTLFKDYFINMAQLHNTIIQMDEIYDLIKENKTTSLKELNIYDKSGNILEKLLSDSEKEKLLKEKVNKNKLELQKIFRNVGIFDLSKYGIKF